METNPSAPNAITQGGGGGGGVPSDTIIIPQGAVKVKHFFKRIFIQFMGKNIHEKFLKKCLTKLRGGGIMVNSARGARSRAAKKSIEKAEEFLFFCFS
jgi:hypothetical protein